MKINCLYMRKIIALLLISLIAIFIVLVVSMNQYRISKKVNAETIISNMIGDTLFFPKYVVSQNQKILIDSILNNSEYKIVSYVDTSDCYSCHLQLKKWKEYISEISDDKNELQVLFVFGRGIIKDDAENLISMSNWNQPVIYDTNAKFYQQNKIPSQFNFQTMLIDNNNVIIAIGNPITNPRVKSLFNKFMGKDISSEKITSVEFSCKKVVFDEMRKDSIYTRSIFIKNTGKEKLRLLEVSTSCDCVETLVKKIDAISDDKIEIVVKYKVIHESDLSERIIIKLNTKPQQTIVNVEGNYKH